MTRRTYGPRRRPGGYGPRGGWVYYVLAERNGEAAIKIGISNTVLRRTRQLRGILLASHDGNGRVEAEMHDRFVAETLGQEWFRPSPALLLHICQIPRRSRAAVEAADEAAIRGGLSITRGLDQAEAELMNEEPTP